MLPEPKPVSPRKSTVLFTRTDQLTHARVVKQAGKLKISLNKYVSDAVHLKLERDENGETNKPVEESEVSTPDDVGNAQEQRTDTPNSRDRNRIVARYIAKQ